MDIKERFVSFEYEGVETTVDLRRIVAISKPLPTIGKFLIYFENAVWSVDESHHNRVCNAWLNAL